MSDEIGRGFRDAVEGVVEGIILSVFLGVIPKLQLVPADYVGLFQLLEIGFLVGSILIIPKMESWRISYLAGWLFASWMMSSAGVIESWLFALYAVVGTVVLVVKSLQKLEESLRNLLS